MVQSVTLEMELVHARLVGQAKFVTEPVHRELLEKTADKDVTVVTVQNVIQYLESVCVQLDGEALHATKNVLLVTTVLDVASHVNASMVLSVTM
uniref:Uncharacterized protein n=1 Tax=Arion vulgaris TaxID=1028688 RepID=A0A0B6ZAM4_9EUPU